MVVFNPTGADLSTNNLTGNFLLTNLTFNSGPVTLSGNPLAFTWNNAAIITATANPTVVNNNLVLASDLTVKTTSGDLTLGGTISGAGTLTKQSGNTLNLSGTYSNTNSLTCLAGTINFNGTQTGGGAVSVSGSGTLSGTGIISGPVTVGLGGTLSPGVTNVGQLTINNSLNLASGGTTAMQVGKGLTNYADLIVGVTTLTYGGTLSVTAVAGTVFAAGDTFNLFDAAHYAGKFSATNLPALSGKLKWTLTGLTNDGTIQVVPTWSVPAVFANNMVLQRGIPVPVWGTAEPSQSVTVTFAGQTKNTTTGADRKWIVRLDPMLANTNSQTLTITLSGVSTTTCTNVLVGDVWLASGQSNMEKDVAYVTNSAAEIASANYPLIRQMKVGYHASITPAWDVTALKPWRVCSPAVFTTNNNWTAVGYFFARILFQSNNVPIGILEADWGGTPAEAWTSLPAMQAVPELKITADQKINDYFQGTQTNLQLVASALYNGLISPLIPFGIRGVIWYQGENNANTGGSMQYRVLFPTLIQDWRSRWQQADLPFYFVQLASYDLGNNWFYLREAQLLTLQTATNTGMAVAIDIGNQTNIHPYDKQDVGARLAAWALNRTYGFTNVVPSGPLFRSYTIETNQIRIYFDYADSGLMTGQKNDINPLSELVGVAPRWFEIAGANQIYYPATAIIDTNNNTVVVSSPSVPNPTLARYAWTNYCQGTNLYSRAGLPASPFRIPLWTTALPVASVQLNAGNVQSSCAVANNVTWWVEFNDRLAGSIWAPLVLPQTGTNGVQTIADPMSARVHRFYRWRQLPY